MNRTMTFRAKVICRKLRLFPTSRFRYDSGKRPLDDRCGLHIQWLNSPPSRQIAELSETFTFVGILEILEDKKVTVL